MDVLVVLLTALWVIAVITGSLLVLIGVAVLVAKAIARYKR